MSPYREPSLEYAPRSPWFAIVVLALFVVSTAALVVATAAYARAGDAWRQCGGVQ